jgi:exodeoxyribonuclease VII large subunit
MADGARQLFDPEAPPEPTASEPRPRAGGPDRRDHGEPPVATETAFDPELHRDTHPDVLSIGALYNEVDSALTRAFPRTRPLWVRGEISHLTDHRSGHLYLDLVDPDEDRPAGPRGRGGEPTLKVKCWRTSWAPLRHALAKEGIELAVGMIVVLRGTIDLYRAKGEVSLTLVEIDVTALLGRLAAQRAQLLRQLDAEGLLRRNAALPVPEVPLHVGLVASPGTEGCRDFLGRLTESGFGFRVSLVKVPVQGAVAPSSIARAVHFLSRSDCDVIVLVRGGGSKADLAAFDNEIVARAVAAATKPVFTGIGHTGDETVADLVANRVCVTPTECGHQIAVTVGQWWASRVARPAGLLSQRVPAFLAAAESRDAQARGRLTAAARHQLRVHRERLATKASALSRAAPARVDAVDAALRARSGRLASSAAAQVDRASEQVASWRRLLAAYDVERQLERGYSLTLTADGALVRGIGQLAEGQEIVTRLADGSLRSTVSASEARPQGAGPERGAQE